MPTKSLKPCGKPGCGQLTAKNYCDKHVPKDGDKFRPSARKRGYNKKWEKYRAAYLAMPGHELCWLRLDSGCTIVADCVDHIVPHDGDINLFWDSANHQPACVHCNSVKRRRIIRGTPPGEKVLKVVWGPTGGQT